jgi:hypothetical protein
MKFILAFPFLRNAGYKSIIQEKTDILKLLFPGQLSFRNPSQIINPPEFGKNILRQPLENAFLNMYYLKFKRRFPARLLTLSVWQVYPTSGGDSRRGYFTVYGKERSSK